MVIHLKIIVSPLHDNINDLYFPTQKKLEQTSIVLIFLPTYYASDLMKDSWVL